MNADVQIRRFRNDRLLQFRHQTKNLLQTVILRLHHLQHMLPEAEQGVIEELVARIQTATILGDALVGEPRPFACFRTALLQHARSVATVFAPCPADVAVQVDVRGEYPAPLQLTLLRAANEMVGNAVKHAALPEVELQIDVRVRVWGGFVALAVRDNGPGFHPQARNGGGMAILQSLAHEHRGRISWRNATGATVRLTLPVD